MGDVGLTSVVLQSSTSDQQPSSMALSPHSGFNHHGREGRDHDDPLDLRLGARLEDVHGARHGGSEELDLQQQRIGAMAAGVR